jgi:hypothetical protein
VVLLTMLKTFGSLLVGKLRLGFAVIKINTFHRHHIIMLACFCVFVCCFCFISLCFIYLIIYLFELVAL